MIKEQWVDEHLTQNSLLEYIEKTCNRLAEAHGLVRKYLEASQKSIKTFYKKAANRNFKEGE